LGWVVGRNVQIDFRYGLGNAANIRKYAAELVALAPDVILVSGALALAPLLQVTRTVPIVFVSIADPVGTGLVASLARPGQNVTGLSSQTSELAGKRLEVLRELIPGLHRLAILANADAPHAVLEMADTEKTARKLGIEVVTSEIRRAEDIAPAFEAFKGRADALVVSPEPLMFTNRLRINILAAAARLPEAGIKATASLFN
jgi:putative ABC transport system substrate-binding protein